MKGRIYKAYKDSLEQKYPSFAQITEDQEFWHSDFWTIQNAEEKEQRTDFIEIESES